MTNAHKGSGYSDSGEKFVLAYIPDFDINTQGTDIADAIEMARDAIGVVGIDMEDDGEALPEPTVISEVITDSADTVTLVVWSRFL